MSLSDDILSSDPMGKSLYVLDSMNLQVNLNSVCTLHRFIVARNHTVAMFTRNSFFCLVVE